MRRGLASLILGLSLVVASASWAGFIMSRTVLDPGRSEALADTLLDDEVVRGVVVDRLADAVEAQIPASVPVSRETIEAGAEIALEDPRLEAAVRDGIVKTHQNALAGVDEPVALDASALGIVGRESLVGLRPELDAVLPAAPTLAVELPGSGLSWLGGVKNTVDRFTQVSAAIAAIGVTAGFVMARNRGAALRRVAFWALGASLFWVAVAYGLPAVLEFLAPSSVSIAAALIEVFLGAMVRPALFMAAFGVGLLLTSFVWPALSRRRPAALVNRPAPARGALDQGLPVLEGTVRTASSTPVSAPGGGYGRAPGGVDPGHPRTEPVPTVSPGSRGGPGGNGDRFHPDDIGPYPVSDSRHWAEPLIPTTAWPEPGNGNAGWPDQPNRPSEAERPRRDGRPASWSEPRRSSGGAWPDSEGRMPRSSDEQASAPRWIEGVGYVDAPAPDDPAG